MPGEQYLNIKQGRRWEKMMLVKLAEGGSADLLCRQCLRTFTLTLKKTHHDGDTVQHCPFCRSSRVVAENEGVGKDAESRFKEADEAARKGYNS